MGFGLGSIGPCSGGAPCGCGGPVVFTIYGCNEVVEDALVEIFSDSGYSTLVDSGTTDVDGHVSLSVPSSDTYYVRVTPVDLYAIHESPMSIAPGSTPGITLDPDDGHVCWNTGITLCAKPVSRVQPFHDAEYGDGTAIYDPTWGGGIGAFVCTMAVDFPGVSGGCAASTGVIVTWALPQGGNPVQITWESGPPGPTYQCPVAGGPNTTTVEAYSAGDFAFDDEAHACDPFCAAFWGVIPAVSGPPVPVPLNIYTIADADIAIKFGDGDCGPEPIPPVDCTPCDIPAKGLCLFWTNRITGDGFAPLAYNSVAGTWTSGCLSYGNGMSISFTLKCTGGNWDITIRGYENDTTCTSISDTYVITTGVLELAPGYTCDPLSVTYTVPSLCSLNLKQGFSSFTVEDGPCPKDRDCNPCDLPIEDLTVSWTGPVGAGSATLVTFGSYWLSNCEEKLYGTEEGSISFQLNCDGSGTTLRVNWNHSRYSCDISYAGYNTDNSATGHLSLTSSTCSPLSLTFTAGNPSDLYTDGFRTFVITL